MITKYKLIGRLPVPCGDLDEWAMWFETANRHVAESDIGPFHVSTVFLGLDFSFRVTEFGRHDPMLFETMVSVDEPEILKLPLGGQLLLDHKWLDYQERCSTWDEAEKMHARGVTFAEELFAEAQRSLGEWACTSHC